MFYLLMFLYALLSAEAATTTHKVSVNTAGLIGHSAAPFSLAFQLSDAGLVGDGNTTIKITDFNFGGGSPVGTPTTFGAASGNALTSITLTDSEYLNYVIQSFTPGSILTFSITIISNGADADQMSFSILDRSGNEIPTQSPERFFQVLVSASMDTQIIKSFGSDASKVPASGGEPIGIPVVCPYGLSKAITSAGSFGDLAGVNVYTGAGCPWSPTTSGGWLTVRPAGQVTGPGKLDYTIVPNATNVSRTQTITVGDQSITVVQAAAGCTFAPSLQSSTLGPTANTVTLTVLTAPSCEWTAVAYPNWIAFSGASSGLGSNSVQVNIAANTTSLPRTGIIVVGGQALQIVQQRSSSPSPVAPFSDVPLSYPYADFITLLKQNAITSGCTPTQYCPDLATTRGQMAVFIIRSIEGSDVFSFRSVPYFQDVPSTHIFFKYIQRMKDLGITSGCSPVTYCPDDLVSRGQMAVFLIRGRLSLTAQDSFPFSNTAFFDDVPSSNPYYSFIQKLRELAVTSGCGATAYCPDAPTTRGQMAVFLIRAFFTP
jgi:S-layer homology domain/Viral BACON domain/Putative binding domain, N-terminal